MQTKLLIAAAIFFAGVTSGWTLNSWKAGAEQAAAIRATEAKYTEWLQDAANMLEQEAEKQQEIRYVYRTIREKAVDVAPTDCLDADSIRMWNDAVFEANTKTGKPDGGVSSPASP